MADKTKTKDSEENAIRVGLAKFGFLKIFITTNVYHINSTSDKNAVFCFIGAIRNYKQLQFRVLARN